MGEKLSFLEMLETTVDNPDRIYSSKFVVEKIMWETYPDCLADYLTMFEDKSMNIYEEFQKGLVDGKFEKEDIFWADTSHLTDLIKKLSHVYPENKKFAVEILRILFEARRDIVCRLDYEIEYFDSVEMLKLLLDHGARLADSHINPDIAYRLLINVVDMHDTELLKILLDRVDYDPQMLSDVLNDAEYEPYDEDQIELLVRKGGVLEADQSAYVSEDGLKPSIDKGLKIDIYSDEVQKWLYSMLPGWKVIPTDINVYEKVYVISEKKIEQLKPIYDLYPMLFKITGTEGTFVQCIKGKDIFKKICREAASRIDADQGIITIPENVAEISKGTFKNQQIIRKIIIPEWVISIKKEAFMGCESLEEVVFKKNRISYIGEAAFKDCKNLKSIQFSEKTVIADEAFMNCTSLSEVKKIAGNDIIEEYDSCRNRNTERKIVWGKQAFANCVRLKEVKGFSVDIIDDRCFEGCASLSLFDNYIKFRLGDFAFKGCLDLEHVFIRGGYVPDYMEPGFSIRIGKLPFPVKKYQEFDTDQLYFDFEQREDLRQYTEQMLRQLPENY